MNEKLDKTWFGIISRHNFDWLESRLGSYWVFFLLRLNTYTRSGSFAHIFDQANPNTVYGSIFKNNMDDSSFNDVDDSLMKTINLPKQAFGGFQEHVSANSETACKVSNKSFFHP